MFWKRARNHDRASHARTTHGPRSDCELQVHWSDDSGVHVADVDLSYIYAPEGDASLLTAALQSKLPLEHSCGGYGTCGTCLVHVEDGLEFLDERNELESEMALERGFKKSERLACQTPLPQAIDNSEGDSERELVCVKIRIPDPLSHK